MRPSSKTRAHPKVAVLRRRALQTALALTEARRALLKISKTTARSTAKLLSVKAKEAAAKALAAWSDDRPRIIRRMSWRAAKMAGVKAAKAEEKARSVAVLGERKLIQAKKRLARAQYQDGKAYAALLRELAHR